jgi:hypothetical protein
MQPGDIPVTYADITLLEQGFGFKPSTPLCNAQGILAEWYKATYGKTSTSELLTQ